MAAAASNEFSVCALHSDTNQNILELTRKIGNLAERMAGMESAIKGLSDMIVEIKEMRKEVNDIQHERKSNLKFGAGIIVALQAVGFCVYYLVSPFLSLSPHK